jgi:ankyrin repeat protein
LNNNPGLGKVLLDGGANPNDNESLYHSTEHPDLECVRLLLRYGAKVNGTNALKHALDREDPECIHLLLEAGGDVNETGMRGQTALHWAVWRGRSVAIIAMIIDAGVNLDAARNDGLTAYAMAVQTGQAEVAKLLKDRGANTDVSVPEATLTNLAENHHTAGVRDLLAKGIDVNSRGHLGVTALHWACWKGYADLVELLLQHGASITIVEYQFNATPLGWFTHGVQNCKEGSKEYPRVARLLIAAGAKIGGPVPPTGNPEVDAVLREHGLLSGA